MQIFYYFICFLGIFVYLCSRILPMTNSLYVGFNY